MASTAPKSNVPMIVGAVLGTLVFAVSTYVVVETAGGTDLSPSYSNTPNGVHPGPPAFK